MKRIIDVIPFLGERGQALRGRSQRIGEGQWEFFEANPILKEHVLQVKEFQEKGERLQVHHLSANSQNELITECSELVKQYNFSIPQNVKYFAIIVDSTPDVSHVEQTTFLLRYVIQNESQIAIVERFLKFIDWCDKNGSDVSQIIVDTLIEHDIPLSDCRAQGCDNAANMSGKYKGAEARILELCPTAIFSQCGCHSLNLYGNDAAECIPESIK